MTIRKPTSGNRNGPRGSRYVQNIHISREAAISLRILTLNARGVRNRQDITEDQIVEELIEAAWREYDAGISKVVAQEWDEKTC